MKKLLSLIAVCICASTAWSQADTSIKKNDSLILFRDTINIPSSIDTIVAKADSNGHIFKVLKGIASFYSRNLEGTKTATGERFRHDKLTGASNNFRLNSWVRVTNLSNGKSVIIRINDRMHPRMARKGRVIDVTRLAAQKLNFIKKGLTKVLVEEVPKGTVD